MKNLCKILGLILGLSLAPVHAAAFKTGLKIAGTSAKLLMDNKSSAALAAGGAYIYYINRYHAFPVAPGMPSMLAKFGTVLNCIGPVMLCGGSVKSTALGALWLSGLYYHSKESLSDVLVHAARANQPGHQGAYVECYNGPIGVPEAAFAPAIEATQNPDFAQWLADHGGAQIYEGHKALVQHHPAVAQAVFKGRQNELAKTIANTTQLPEDVAAFVASFDTGITVKKPLSGALAAASLDKDLDAALKAEGWDK